MRNFKDFMDKDIAVSFADENEQMEFAKLCDKNSIQWPASGKATKLPHHFCNLNCCTYGKLEYAQERYFKEEGYEIVPASEFLTQSHPETDIRIFSRGRSTICLKYENGKVVARGVAKCHMDDEWNANVGADIAFDRMKMDERHKALMKTGSDCIKTLKNGMKIRKQDKYEVGDKVLMKKKTSLNLLNEMKYCTGKVCTIKNLDDMSGVELEESGGYCFLNNDIKGKVIE